VKLASVLLLGIVAGLIGALCGVGGGIVIVPALVHFLGFNQKQAIATSLAVIVVNAAVATFNNHQRGGGLIEWKVVLFVGLGAALASWFGSELMRSMSNSTLTRLFGVVLLFFGVRMLWKG
jgi:uncharacterized membrane protein YfcA